MCLPSRHEGIRRGVDMKFHLSWTLELGTGYLHALATLHLKKRLLYPLDRRLDWFQRRRALCEAEKNYCPAWNRTLVVKSAFSLLGGLWLLSKPDIQGDMFGFVIRMGISSVR